MGAVTPDEVPAFPQYVISYDEQAQSARLDGVPIEAAPGVSLRQAALIAAARKAEAHGLDAVRVVIRASTGEQWTMIVPVQGEPLDTTTPAEPLNTGRTRKRAAVVLMGVSLLALLGVGTAVAVHLSADSDQGQDGVPSWDIPGVGNQVPVGLPERFTGPADWAVSINGDTAATSLSDGRILTANSERILSARDPETAEPTWAGSNAPTDLSEIHESTWADTEVLASYSRGDLNLWVLDDITPGDAVAPEQVPVAHNAEVLWEGDTPLVDLGDFVVLIPDDEGVLTELTIPAGSQPVSAVDAQAVSVGAEAIYRTGLDGESTVTEFSSPDAATGPPESFWVINTDALVLTWPSSEVGQDSVVAVIDQNTGETIIEDQLPRVPHGSTELVYDADSARAVIGGLSIRYDEDSEITEIASVSDPVLHAETLYGNSADGPITLDLTDPAEGPQTYPTFTEQDSAPLIAADDAAYVVAPRLGETILYRAPADTDEEDAAETSENGDNDS